MLSMFADFYANPINLPSDTSSTPNISTVAIVTWFVLILLLVMLCCVYLANINLKLKAVLENTNFKDNNSQLKDSSDKTALK